MTTNQISVQNQAVLNTPPKEAKKEAEAPKAEQKDSVELQQDGLGKKILKFPGKVITKTVGVATGVVDGAIGVIPSTIGGIASALSVDPPDPSGQYGPHKGDAEGGYGIAYVLQAGAAGAVAGGMTMGLWGAIGLGVGGLVVGGVKMGIDHATGHLKHVADKIEDATYEPILDNKPTGDKMYDAGKNISEGGILGMKAGVKENFKLGQEKAGGTLAGVWEGTKGSVKTIFHKDPAPPASETEKTSAWQQVKNGVKFVLALPKNALKVALGTACGIVGAGLGLPLGVIEGLGEGSSHHGDAENISISRRTPGRFLQTEATIMGGAAGAIIGQGVLWSILGGAGGVVAGLVIGGIASRIMKNTGAGEQIATNMENHMKRAVADNKDLGSELANRHRDVVEGAMVGTTAGMKEGFSTGYDVGAGFVQGVSDGIIGVGKGLKGAFDAISGSKTPKPQKTEENNDY